MVITIDGLGGTGKSTQAKLLAKKIGFTYFNSGSLFRYITVKLVQDDVNFNNATELNNYLKNFNFNFDENGNLLLENGITMADLNTADVSYYSALIATIPSVRKKIVDEEHKFGNSHNTIMEGRDIGSVIFPNAELKFLLLASPKVRAKRVFSANRDDKSYDEIYKMILDRDNIETTKNTYTPPKDAIKIETDNLSFDEVAHLLYQFTMQKFQENSKTSS